MELEDRLTLPGAEGLDLHLVLAGLGSRAVAAMIDAVIQTLTVLIMAVIGGQFVNLGAAIVAISGFMVLFGYPVMAETFANGQTIGKRVMRIAVVRLDGTPVTFLSAVIRNVIRVVDALPGTYFVGCAAVLASSRNQRIGDMVAGTLVALRPKSGQSSAGMGYPSGMSMAPGPSPELAGWDVSAVTAEEVAAIRSFLVRRGTLDGNHRAQLAQTLSFQILPKVAGVPLDGGPEAFLERIVAAKSSR
ncbi:MAG: RDD family protein [Aquihabitans sp.]